MDAGEGRCPISFIPLEELTHPVVLRGQRALVVFDAEHLIRWLKTSRRNPVTNEMFNPFSPISELMEPHRLAHTTDDQIKETRRLISEKRPWPNAYNWMEIRVDNAMDIAMAPACVALTMMITAIVLFLYLDVVIYIHTKAADAVLNHRAQYEKGLRPGLLEFYVTYARITRRLASVYVEYIHTPMRGILFLYFRIDVPIINKWCAVINALLSLDPVEPEMQGLRGLLSAC